MLEFGVLTKFPGWRNSFQCVITRTLPGLWEIYQLSKGEPHPNVATKSTVANCNLMNNMIQLFQDSRGIRVSDPPYMAAVQRFFFSVKNWLNSTSQKTFVTILAGSPSASLLPGKRPY